MYSIRPLSGWLYRSPTHRWAAYSGRHPSRFCRLAPQAQQPGRGAVARNQRAQKRFLILTLLRRIRPLFFVIEALARSMARACSLWWSPSSEWQHTMIAKRSKSPSLSHEWAVPEQSPAETPTKPAALAAVHTELGGKGRQRLELAAASRLAQNARDDVPDALGIAQ